MRSSSAGGTGIVKYVLNYETADGALPLARTLFPAHRTRADGFKASGVLLMIGTWADPSEGAMAVFTTREAAEEFAREDPFVLQGVVKSWAIREWNEVMV
jgi:uncharacterized protein YciI